ncbi:MAG: homoserine dehydrogenase [Desulfobacterales bacterium]|nr:homoserine dehydrogenase [Desulfobacterales bacterium]
MQEINVGLLGMGTVGEGVARLLIKNRELIRSRVGTPVHLKRVADIDVSRARNITLENGVFTTDALSIVNDPDIHIVLEMIGGQTVAKELILKAMENGKHVVTANKALLANQGQQIFQAAYDNDVDLAFEPSVGGCMPIIKLLRESLVGNHIYAMTGILNGTCNYILTKITEEGISFESALADAQASGFAEADPTMDVEGFDTAHKLAILTALAFGMNINFKDIYIEGISRITPLDIRLAEEFGFCIKLLAISKMQDNGVEARVHPTMIASDNILSSVRGSLNAVTISGDAVGDLFLSGHGAGMMPTASAVISDIVDIARNILNRSTGRVPLLAYQTANIKQIPIIPIDRISTHYYIRFSALDQPGVLSKISGILGNHDISIKSVQQKGRKQKGSVPIVMMTHRAKESAMKQALAEIALLNVISYPPTLIRIEDENDEE